MAHTIVEPANDSYLPSRRGPLRTGASAAERERAAALHLASLPQCAIWLWTDGSAEGGVSKGGAGTVIVWPDKETKTYQY